MPELLYGEKEAYAAIEHSLTNHAPPSASTIASYEEIREAAKAFALQIVQLCPEGRERSLAVTKLEETVMWAIKAIAVRNYVKTTS